MAFSLILIIKTKIMKLISMTDFVMQKALIFDDDNSTDKDCENAIESIFQYAIFLKQPLTLGMFTPCDENDNVFPSHIELGKGLLQKHEEAKERVLFSGFKITEQPKSENIEFTLNRDMVFVGIKYRKEKHLRLNDIMAKSNIESLVYRGLDLAVSF